jgi:hypothetical protein
MGHHLVISCAFIQLQSQQIGEPKMGVIIQNARRDVMSGTWKKRAIGMSEVEFFFSGVTEVE